ncbi:MAG TPA: hypothetical protein VK894_14700, partial [Jiangellales bacterium]|nr:hypothetical protein [Jiangellales bacterium]
WVMHRLLSAWLPALPRSPFVLATVVVAVSGWVLGSLPSALISAAEAGEAAQAGGTVTAEPPLILLAAVFALGGAVAGAAFGGAQAVVLRRHVARPRRWVAANVVAWAIGVTVITVGATVVPAGWPVAGLAAYGAVVGLLAGLVVGAVTGYALPGLQDTGPRARRRQDRLVLGVLRGPAHRLLSGSMMELRYTGPRTGLVHALPVQYARRDGTVAVLVGHSGHKRWWRAVHATQHVDALLDGEWWRGEARVLEPGDAHYVELRRFWRERFPKAHPGPHDPIVEISLDVTAREDGRSLTHPRTR